MMDFTHIDGRDWPIVRHKGRSITMVHGRDYVTLSDGIHLTTEGMFKLGDFTDDVDLMAIALGRRQRDGARVEQMNTVLRYSRMRPDRAAALRRMHEEGER